MARSKGQRQYCTEKSNDEEKRLFFSLKFFFQLNFYYNKFERNAANLGIITRKHYNFTARKKFTGKEHSYIRVHSRKIFQKDLRHRKQFWYYAFVAVSNPLHLRKA